MRHGIAAEHRHPRWRHRRDADRQPAAARARRRRADHRRRPGRRARLPAGADLPAVRARRAREHGALARRAAARGHPPRSSPRSTGSRPRPTRVVLADGTELPLRRARRRHRRAPPARGDRGPDRRRAGTRRAFTFYTVEGATALRDALQGFDGGRLVVNVVDMPIKCPVAPLEFAFLADWYFTDRGIRDDVEHHVRHAARRRVHQAGRLRRSSAGCWRRRAIRLETEFATGEVDGAARRPAQLGRARGAVRPARDGPAARRRGVRGALARASATTSGSSAPTSTRCRRRARRTSS